MNVEGLLKFAAEREVVRLRREAGEPGPWTQDLILQTYRFCNVERENDKVTRWIAENWRTPHAKDPDLWFAMVIARFINWPDTLLQLAYPVPYDRERFLRTMRERKAKKLKCYGNAYMIRSDSSNKGGDKATYQAVMQFDPLWARRKTLRPTGEDTLNSYHMLLCQLYGLSSFMAAQVVADLKYVAPLNLATDWWTFAASGPGSRRGLNLVLGLAMNESWSEEGWRMELKRLYAEILPLLPEYGLPKIHAQDLQNCLCEYSKYEKARLGSGRPKEKFRGV